MNRFVLSLLSLALILVSAYLGFRLYNYQNKTVETALPETGLGEGRGYAGAPPRPASGNAEVLGRIRPDFSLPDINGRLRSVSEWDGKVLAVNFWATWCPPCLKEIPAFVLLQSKYETQGLQFVGVALHKPEQVRQFVIDNKMNYPVLTGEFEVIELAEALGNHTGALPYTVIIDRDGLIAYVKRGPLSTEQAEGVIGPLL